MPLIALLLSLLILAAPASAATVSADEGCDMHFCHLDVNYKAAPGEANALTVTRDAATVAFVDAAPVKAGKGCIAIAGGARCAIPGEADAQVSARLGDGDDTATLDREAAVLGEAGNDTITGQGYLSGGPGTDLLTADGGPTTFRDNDGVRASPDRYVGGPERDAVSYLGQKSGVVVDQRPARRARWRRPAHRRRARAAGR